jgi:hypothetical protein
MSTETRPEGCPFSPETHIRADGKGIKSIERGNSNDKYLWEVEFEDGNFYYNQQGEILYEEVYEGYNIITREEYDRLQAVPVAAYDPPPADPWAKSPITKQEVWLRAWCAALDTTSKQPYARCGGIAEIAVADFEARFITQS